MAKIFYNKLFRIDENLEILRNSTQATRLIKEIFMYWTIKL